MIDEIFEIAMTDATAEIAETTGVNIMEFVKFFSSKFSRCPFVKISPVKILRHTVIQGSSGPMHKSCGSNYLGYNIK